MIESHAIRTFLGAISHEIAREVEMVLHGTLEVTRLKAEHQAALLEEGKRTKEGLRGQ